MAVLKFNPLQDHCVGVLGVERNGIIVGDPPSGLSLVSTEEFESKWLFAGIVLKRIGARQELLPAQKPAKRDRALPCIRDSGEPVA